MRLSTQTRTATKPFIDHPLRRGQALMGALHHGLGKAESRLAWHVNPVGRIVFSQSRGQLLYLGGFRGRQEVFSRFREEDGRIVGRFYASAAEANSAQQPLKTAVFSERVKDSGWQSLSKPKLVQTDQASYLQVLILRARQLTEFLLEDRPERATFDIGERKVSRDGRVLLLIDKTRVSVCGLNGYEKVFGQVIVRGSEKRAYFWPSESAKQKKAKPIIPAGTPLARRTAGQWQIIWFDLGSQRRQEKFDSLRLGNYIFSTAGDRVFTLPWTVNAYFDRSCGRSYPKARRIIRGTKLSLSTLGVPGVNGQVFSRSFEIGRRLKLIEFWPDEAAVKRDPAPFAARFMAVNLNGLKQQKRAAWTLFWHPVDSSAETIWAFKDLLRNKAVAYEELDRILGHSFFGSRHYRMRGLIDALADYSAR